MHLSCPHIHAPISAQIRPSPHTPFCARTEHTHQYRPRHTNPPRDSPYVIPNAGGPTNPLPPHTFDNQPRATHAPPNHKSPVPRLPLPPRRLPLTSSAPPPRRAHRATPNTHHPQNQRRPRHSTVRPPSCALDHRRDPSVLHGIHHRPNPIVWRPPHRPGGIGYARPVLAHPACTSPDRCDRTGPPSLNPPPRPIQQGPKTYLCPATPPAAPLPRRPHNHSPAPRLAPTPSTVPTTDLGRISRLFPALAARPCTVDPPAP